MTGLLPKTEFPTAKTPAQHGRCLTEFSLLALVIGALVVSALLWLVIYAVL